MFKYIPHSMRFLLIKRLYNNSSARTITKAPLAKFGSKRVSQALQRRSNDRTDIKTQEHSPRHRFEPFPLAITEANKLEILKRTITPLIDTPYEEQLSKKESYCRNVLREVAKELYKLGTPVRLDIRRLPCQVNSIVGSPDLYKYRNKDEFSIWRGHDGKTVTVGFMAFPISKHGDTVCIEPNGCDIMRDDTIKMTDILQQFLREQAKLPVCYALGQEGGWRRFIIRSNIDNDLMTIGVLNPRTYTVQQVIDERENFKRFMIEKSENSNLKMSSLYFQPCPHNKCYHQDVPYELLHGKPTIIETINDYKFAVSPESYLTPNTRGAEVLYTNVKKTIDECFSYEKSGLKPFIIDLGCGVGVLSIHLSDLASKSIGIDMSKQSIDDAITNAKLNKKENCEFICSLPEIALERVLEKHSQYKNDTLVVCNPPAKGLHQNVISALKQCKEVTKIIYISSRPGSQHTIDNLIDLCRKETGKSLAPFAPISATPVDVYPHLESCELIVALERLPQ